jgi:23S rRNA (adenine2503-C2)-methyltransferase
MNKQSDRTLFGLDLQELTALVEESGQPSYRARQLFQALYRDRVGSADQITTLPKEFRAWLLAQDLDVVLPAIDRQFESTDGTIRYLIRLYDGETIETVWMPEGDDGEFGDGSEAESRSNSGTWRRATICVSSQVGCAVNCQFCLTAKLGVKRNLSAGEIVGQVVAVLRERAVSPPLERVNLVFMGMGEPLLNYENFTKSVRLLVEGVGIPESRMTVSTA